MLVAGPAGALAAVLGWPPPVLGWAPPPGVGVGELLAVHAAATTTMVVSAASNRWVVREAMTRILLLVDVTWYVTVFASRVVSPPPCSTWFRASLRATVAARVSRSGPTDASG